MNDIRFFHTPRSIYFGRGCAEKIGAGIAVVSPSVNARFGKILVKIDKTPVIFKRLGACGEPCEDDVLILSGILRKRVSDASSLPVVAIGGGSVIDAVKLALQFSATPQLVFEKIYNEGITREYQTRLIAVETTAGTGTGVTAVAVVTKKDNIKSGIASPHLIPDEAYYDPDFIDALPADVFASSGMDALTHAVESYVSTIENIPADTMALKAAELIGKNISSGYRGECSARELVHYGNMLAGMAFSNVRLGISHALAHLIGGRFSIPHGRINAILLPYVVEFNSKNTAKYNDITKILKIRAGTLRGYLEKLNRSLGIENSLSPLGDEFKKMIPQIARDCAKAPLMATNPRKASSEEIEELLLETVKQ